MHRWRSKIRAPRQPTRVNHNAVRSPKNFAARTLYTVTCTMWGAHATCHCDGTGDSKRWCAPRAAPDTTRAACRPSLPACRQTRRTAVPHCQAPTPCRPTDGSSRSKYIADPAHKEKKGQGRTEKRREGNDMKGQAESRKKEKKQGPRRKSGEGQQAVESHTQKYTRGTSAYH